MGIAKTHRIDVGLDKGNEMSLDSLIKAVNSVTNAKDVDALVQTFGLRPKDRSNKLDQILGVYTGTVDGRTVQIVHRWYDRCHPFKIQPDGNKVEIEVDGVRMATGGYLDDN